jgi:hypothetical protein
MPRKPAERPNPYFTFLRRLRAGGRSNMYGAIPYLTAAFGCDRNEAFRIVCEWIDAQAGSDAGPATREPAQAIAARSVPDPGDASPPARRKAKRAAPQSRRKASCRKAA